MDDLAEGKPRCPRPSPEFLFFLLVFGWPGPTLLLYALGTRNLALCGFGWILTAWPWDTHGLPLLRAHWPRLDTALRSLGQWLAQPVDTRPGLAWLRQLTPGRCFIATGIACTAVSLLDPARPYEQGLYLVAMWFSLGQIHAIQVRRVWTMSYGMTVDERPGRDRRDGVVFVRSALLSICYFVVVAATGGNALRAVLDSWR